MTTEKSPTKTAVIFAGEIVAVKLLDNSTAQVRVRAMPARHLGRIIALCTDEAALLEFVCQILEGATLFRPVDAEWIDSLTDESHLALIEAAKRLNFSRAEIWGRRQIEAGQMKTTLMTLNDEMLSPVVQKMAHLLISSLQLGGSPEKPPTKS